MFTALGSFFNHISDPEMGESLTSIGGLIAAVMLSIH